MKDKQTTMSPDFSAALEGDLTIYNAMEVKASLLDYLRVADEVELDLSQVCEIDSAGVQLLMLAKHESVRRDKTLRLVSHSRAVLDIFELYNLAAFFGDPLLISHTGKNDTENRGAV